ncbi:MAG: hypothetical protein JWR80_575 [Bradyrhizobium sp.]|nr:hypothetical protein [Bradyrhizobium sp.]
MTRILSTTVRTRRHLLLGSAAGALACALASVPVLAQTTDVHATAARSLVNDQANQGVRVLTDTGDAQLSTVVAGTTDASSITLSDNDVSTTARGNRATQDLAPDALDAASAFGRTTLSAGAAGVTGNAETLIANRQSNKGTEVIANNMDAETGTYSAIAVDAGQVSASKVAVTGNTQEAVALGNDAAGTVATNGGIGSGAGIVSFQTADVTSGVAGRSFGATGITAQGVSASGLAVTGNLERGIAYGNAVDNALTAKPTAIEAPTSGDIASTVPAIGDGDPTTSAAYAILSDQSDAGVVKARAGGGDGAVSGLIVAGDADASSLINDGNALVAAGYGNQSSNRLDLDTVSIARAGIGSTGAVANVTGVQSLGDTARVIATTVPSAITHVFGDASDSNLSVSDNSDQTIAIGNLASGNLLTVRGETIDARQGDPLGGGVVGTALTTPAGDASVSAAFSVQNVQDYGKASIFTSSIGAPAGLEVGGTVSGSLLKADGNTSLVAATGNSADNAATLDATTIATSADVNNLQTGDGNITVSMGDADHRAGATISPVTSVTDSHIAVTNNNATGTATANSSTNSLAVTADTLLDGGGHSDAEAGPIADGYGAAATFALANEQKTGEPSNDGSTTPTIAANILGRFAVTGDGRADQSSLAVEDNVQHAGALANDTVNRMSIAATGHGDDATPVAGVALSSSQYGQANVIASSDAKFAARGAITDSTVSLSGNTNEAVATVNQADNGLSVDGVQLGSVTGGDANLSSGPLGPPFASGDHVLANQQFATGSASATADTRFVDGDVGGGLDGSRFTIADNVTSADAAANRALNTVSVAAATSPAGNAGLVNTQMNAAGVTASATTDAAFIVAGTPLVPAVDSGGVSIDGNQTGALARGNVADNQLVLSGGANPAGVAAAATVEPFDATVHAAGALLNIQASYGAVTATASNTSYGVPLNATGVVNASTVGVTGNSVSAAAYGNVASNAVTVSSLGRLPTAAIANAQVNYGPVTAQVTGASYRVTSGPLSASALSITGNQLAATAVGNQASSTIATTR